MFEAKYDTIKELGIDQVIANYWKKMPLQNWEGSQYSVPYDTAWVATLQNDSGKPLFPQTINWLLQNQALDGSWGSHSDICERLLSTAASVRTLLLYEDKFKGRINLGIKWLYSNLPRLKGGNYIYMAGFEFLLPALLKQFGQYNIDLGPEIKYFQEKQSQKLSKLPMEAVLKQKTAKIFTFEFLDNYYATLPNIDYFLEGNGSLGSTPSTTAWYFSKKVSKKNPEMLQYLQHSRNNDGGFPSFADFQMFTIGYSLYPFLKISEKHEYFKDIVHHQLRPFWRKTGLAFGKFFSIADSDDTSLGLYLLEKYGLISPDNREWDVLDSYVSGMHYSTYPYESDYSNLSNLHIFDAFSISRISKREEALNKLIPFFSNQLPNHMSGFGADKFHLSTYFQNCHGILALSQEAPELAEKLLNWFIANQNDNGLWCSDINHPTLEENAYAILAICYYYITVEKVDLEILKPAIEFLTKTSTLKHTGLWPSKIVYAPIEVINAYILAALIAYKKANHVI